jgi:hypothetical protein
LTPISWQGKVVEPVSSGLAPLSNDSGVTVLDATGGLDRRNWRQCLRRSIARHDLEAIRASRRAAGDR